MKLPWNWIRCLAAVSALGTLAAGAMVVTGNMGKAGAKETLVPTPAADNPEPSAEEKAVRATEGAYVKAFNAGDAKAVAALWTEDGELIDAEGKVTRGREAIAKEFADSFAQQPGMTMDISTESVRFVGTDVAIESGTMRVKPATGAPVRIGQYHTVHVEKDGQWRMASVQESQHAPTSNYEYLRDLEWLIGSWTGQNDERIVETAYAWTANKNFIHRTYTVKISGKTTHSGHEIIGWDPTVGTNKSWLFDSEGGFGTYVWSHDGQHWAIEAKGVHRDGSQTEATNILTPVDANTYTWQSTHRTRNEVSLPDTAELKVVRDKAKK
jgi:uncharacterized protein (TIGR02246 family)